MGSSSFGLFYFRKLCILYVSTMTEIKIEEMAQIVNFCLLTFSTAQTNKSDWNIKKQNWIKFRQYWMPVFLNKIFCLYYTTICMKINQHLILSGCWVCVWVIWFSLNHLISNMQNNVWKKCCPTCYKWEGRRKRKKITNLLLSPALYEIGALAQNMN